MAGDPTLVPRSVAFRREREQSWRRLDALVTRIESSGLTSLSARDLVDLPVLYRATLSSLAVARSTSLDRNAVEYLETLASRAYFAVYGPKQGFWQRCGRFLSHDFPSAVRESGGAVAASTGILGLGMVTAWVLVSRDPAYYFGFVDAGLASGRDPSASTEYLKSTLFDGGDTSMADLGEFASFLFQHNARVGILAFVTGFMGGIPSALLMFSTGLMLGAFSALFHDRGLAVEYWSWILPHGVTEIGAVVLCGAAGLAIGRALLFPGALTRRAAMALAGRRAARIAMGAVVMLVLAALIEGIFRQTVQSLWIRYLVVVVTTVFWGAYFVAQGRRDETRKDLIR